MRNVRYPGPVGRAPMRSSASARGRKIVADVVHATTPLPALEAKLAKTEKGKASIPQADGEINLYVFHDLDESDQKQIVDDVQQVIADIDWNRRSVFINGMGNAGKDNMNSSCALSLLLLCPVISIYNRQSDLWGDLAQCLRDKLKFQAQISEAEAFEQLAERHNAKSKAEKIKVMKHCLGTGIFGNKATASLFEVLATGPGVAPEVPIYAHSQGNLILSNALQAVKLVLGPQGIEGRQVFSYGSPAVVWPSEIKHFDHAFTFDLVSLLNVIPAWGISKVGWPEGTPWPFTHGFDWYLREDAAFIVNRHRVGGWGITVSMDEDGLADELVSFGSNERRLIKVFERLDTNHNSDVDDVAVAYVNRMRAAGKTASLRQMKTLTANLIRYLDEGWTSSDENELIKFLKAL